MRKAQTGWMFFVEEAALSLEKNKLRLERRDRALTVVSAVAIGLSIAFAIGVTVRAWERSGHADFWCWLLGACS